jgi:hypothetical protein
MEENEGQAMEENEGQAMEEELACRESTRERSGKFKKNSL